MGANATMAPRAVGPATGCCRGRGWAAIMAKGQGLGDLRLRVRGIGI